MNNPGFRPNRGRYLVLPTEIKGQETKIEGSEYTIESAKDPHAKPSEGTVVAVGKECIEFQPGDTVLYGKYSGYPQEFDGREYIILAESEILGERLVTPFDEPLPDPGKMRKALTEINRSLDPDNTDGYRAADPEGAMDTAYYAAVNGLK